MIRIYCTNTGTTKDFEEGTSLLEMLDSFDFPRPYQIVSAKVNNVSQGLKFRAYRSKTVEFLDARERSGMRVYNRSLAFLMCKAVKDVFPEGKIYIEHPISNSYFCYLKKGDKSQVKAEDVAAIAERMHGIVGEDLPFKRLEVPVEEAVKIFKESGSDDKVKLLHTSGEIYTDYYTLGETPEYFYGRLVPSAGYLKVWDLVPYHNGLLLRVPDKNDPEKLAPFTDQPKTFEVFRENLRWNSIMGLATVGDVNIAVQNGYASELIQVAEALQEKKIVQIAEEIERRHNSDKPLKIVLITGPSSSGKTTFCKRISVQLKACGLRPLSICTDDYFVDREKTPLLPNGKYDFDNFETVDHKMLEKDVLSYLRGEEVNVPEFNFVTGKREYKGKKLRQKKNTVLLIEGIHALNPELIPSVDSNSLFRIFISTLSSINLDNHNWIPTSDNRLLRRIIRDYSNGSFTALQTISQWPSVRDSEEKWIYPYQERADIMFNSAYLIEFAVLRNHAQPILESVPRNCAEYSEAHRLLKFIKYFNPVSDKEIPFTSLLREFLKQQ